MTNQYYHRDAPTIELQVIRILGGGLDGYFILMDEFGDTIKASKSQLNCDDKWMMYGMTPLAAFKQKVKYSKEMTAKAIEEMNKYTESESVN